MKFFLALITFICLAVGTIVTAYTLTKEPTPESILINTAVYAIVVLIAAYFFSVNGGMITAFLALLASTGVFVHIFGVGQLDKDKTFIYGGQGALYFILGYLGGTNKKLRRKIEKDEVEVKKSRKELIERKNQMQNYMMGMVEHKTEVAVEGMQYYTKILKASKLAKEFSSTFNLEDIYNTTINAAKSLLGSTACALFFKEGEKESFRCVKSYCWDGTYINDIVIEPNEGILGWVINNKQFVSRRSALSDPKLRELMGMEKFKFDIAIPLIHKDEVTGLLIIQNFIKNPEKEEDWESIFGLSSIISSLSAISIENAKNYTEIQNLATMDGLTKIYNHRLFQDLLSKSLKDNLRKNRKASIILIDIDFFKRFNDNFGHQVGDMVLVNTANLLKSNLRPMDFAARYGGEEFVVVLNDSTDRMAYETAERLRGIIEQSELLHNDMTLKITASMGVSTFPEHGKNNAELIKSADVALYRAKEEGRNRVIGYE